MIVTSPDPEAPGVYTLAVPTPGCHHLDGDNANVGWIKLRDRMLRADADGVIIRPIDTGDYTYAENDTDDEAVHRAEHELVMQQVDGYAKTARDWGMDQEISDHEFLPNNGDSWDSDSVRAGLTVLSQVLAQPLTLDTPEARYYARTEGRVRLIYLDTRSTYRSPSYGVGALDADDPAKTCLGAVQLAWLATELDRDEPLKLIFSDMVWPRREGTPDPGDLLGELHNKKDGWPSYQFEQNLIAGWIVAATHAVHIMNCGDYHALGWVEPENNPWGNFLVLLGNGMNVRTTYRGGYYEDYYPDPDEQGDEDFADDVRQFGWIQITDDTLGFDFSWEAVDALNDEVRFTVTKRYGGSAADAALKYVQLTVGDTAIDRPVDGRQQMEIESGLNGMLVQSAWAPDDGLHGATTGRTTWRPGILGIPFLLRADNSYQLRDRLDKVRRVLQGNQMITATYPDGQQREAPCQFKELVVVELIDMGLRLLSLHDVVDFWLEIEERTTGPLPVTVSGDSIELFDFAGCTGPLVNLEVELFGPWTDPRVRPTDRGRNMHPLHEMIYAGEVGTDDYAIEADRSLQIDTQTGLLTPVFEPGDDWTPNYFGFRSPGSAYTLEVPPGLNSPRITVYGSAFASTTAIQLTGRRAFCSL